MPTYARVQYVENKMHKLKTSFRGRQINSCFAQLFMLYIFVCVLFVCLLLLLFFHYLFVCLFFDLTKSPWTFENSSFWPTYFLTTAGQLFRATKLTFHLWELTGRIDQPTNETPRICKTESFLWPNWIIFPEQCLFCQKQPSFRQNWRVQFADWSIRPASVEKM